MADTGFTGTLKIGETSYDVLSFSMGFGRTTDQKGRPNSRVTATELGMVVEITKETNIVNLMINGSNAMIAEGTLTFTDAGREGVRRKVVFKEGFVTGYSEAFSPSGSDNFTCSVSITANHLEIGTGTPIKYDAGWPVSS